jgi:peptidoglycan hydrolase-like protein with peptidoglycan-binding domain
MPDPVLTQGASGSKVRQLKRLLEAWGKEHPLPEPLADTAQFGQATSLAVRTFQATHGLEVDGAVGAATWAALQAATAPAVASPLVVYEPVEVLSAAAVECEP